MADLQTNYLGLPLRNPLIVAASSVSSRVENIQLAERFGAGAVVLRSLFEEQILADRVQLEDTLTIASDSHAEAADYFPPIHHADATDYLRSIEAAKKAVEIPVIGSLNAVSNGSWTKYAAQMVNSGVDAIELNIYSVATDIYKTAAEIEAELFDIIEAVMAASSVPVSVKLSPYFTSIVNFVCELDRRKAAGVVLFNRFLQPDIDPVNETLNHAMPLSAPLEMRLPLRFTALLHGRIQADIALSTGIHRGEDIAKGLLAGAMVTQVAASIMKNGVHHLANMLRNLEEWMDQRGYYSVEDFRGSMSHAALNDLFAFERAQYLSVMTGASQSAPLNARVN